MDVCECLGLSIKTLLGLIVIGLSVLYLYLYNNYGYWKKREVPFDPPSLLLGNISFLMRRSNNEYFRELANKYSLDYVGIFLGWKPALVVQTPELVKRVFVKDFDNFQDRYLYSGYDNDPLGSLNLFSVKNPIWGEMRQELSPMFTTARLKLITELMNINATQLVGKIKRDFIDSNNPTELKELFLMYTSDTVAYSVFGLRMSRLNDEESPLWTITQHMLHFDFKRGLEFHAIFLLPSLAKLMRLQFFSKSATDYIKKMFHTVVKEREQSNLTNHKDLVNHLLKLKQNLKLPVGSDAKFADDLMMAQVAVFILGSIETSSSTLTHCLHELAHHPEKQQKLYEEIDNCIKTSGKDILQYDELMTLKYLSSCIYETLRKYPVLAYLDRISKAPWKLNDHVTVEAGTPVLINVMAIHFNDKIFPQPDEWRPERMNLTSDNDTLQHTFLPFGDGPRFCIGKRYGMMQVRAAIAQVVHKYRIEPLADEPYLVKPDPYSVILAPKTGGHVKFVLR